FLHSARERRHHVEGDPYPSQGLTGECLPWRVGIDDHVGLRSDRSGKMVIGNEGLDSEAARLLDPRKTGHAVIDGHDQRRLALGSKAHDLRRQTVSVLKSIRHEEVDRWKPESAQLPYDESGARGPIGIEIPHDDDSAAASIVITEQLDRWLHASELTHRDQLIEGQLQLRA